MTPNKENIIIQNVPQLQWTHSRHNGQVTKSVKQHEEKLSMPLLSFQFLFCRLSAFFLKFNVFLGMAHSWTDHVMMFSHCKVHFGINCRGREAAHTGAHKICFEKQHGIFRKVGVEESYIFLEMLTGRDLWNFRKSRWHTLNADKKPINEQLIRFCGAAFFGPFTIRCFLYRGTWPKKDRCKRSSYNEHNTYV